MQRGEAIARQARCIVLGPFHHVMVLKIGGATMLRHDGGRYDMAGRVEGLE